MGWTHLCGHKSEIQCESVPNYEYSVRSVGRRIFCAQKWVRDCWKVAECQPTTTNSHRTVRHELRIPSHFINRVLIVGAGGKQFSPVILGKAQSSSAGVFFEWGSVGLWKWLPLSRYCKSIIDRSRLRETHNSSNLLLGQISCELWAGMDSQKNVNWCKGD